MSILKSSRIPDKSKHRVALKKCVYFLRPCHGGAPLEIVYRIFRSLDVCATSAVTVYKRVEKRPIRPIFRVKILLYHGAVWTSEPPKCTSMYSLSASLSSQYNERFKTTLELQLIMYFLSFHFISPN